MNLSDHTIGIMSGTSLDGIDAVLVDFGSPHPALIGHFYLAYPQPLRERLLALQLPSDNELHHAATLGNELARLYADAVQGLLDASKHLIKKGSDPFIIGCHGQTVRHMPAAGYTLQLGNAALLAELTGMTVVADFRSRDLAAGGQGAPLVPAFHRAVFGHANIHRVIVNIGGIANLTCLPAGNGGNAVTGFDCGPGNLLMDAWCSRHTGQTYDAGGAWAASGQLIPALLAQFLAHPYFALPPPKSAGREEFNVAWLKSCLRGFEAAADVQATLLQLTASSIARAITQYAAAVEEIYLCGGGAHNLQLVKQLKACMPQQKTLLTGALGISANSVEAVAFAWLARQTMLGQPGNLPAVTGAKGERILGAIYKA